MFFPKEFATKLAILRFKRSFVKHRHWKYTAAFHLYLADCFPNTRNTPPPMEEDNSLNPPRSSAVYLLKVKGQRRGVTGGKQIGGV